MYHACVHVYSVKLIKACKTNSGSYMPEVYMYL